MAAPALSYITQEEYLRQEREAETRSEYFAGQVFAMSGGTGDHSLIAANLIREVGVALKGSSCKTFTSDLRVKVDRSGAYTYPDLTVARGGAEFEDRHRDTLLNPTLLVEVLSQSTEAKDRGWKFIQYRQIPALREYLLVSQDRPFLELCVRRGDEWVLREIRGLDATVSLLDGKVSIPLVEIYAHVEFPSAEA